MTPGLSQAEKFPSKPIRLINPTGSGGASDLHARAISSVIYQYLGQPMLVQPMGGGGGKRGYTALRRAKPDGYTIAMGTSGLTMSPHARDMGFDSLKDFVAIYSMESTYFMLLVKADQPWKTLDDLVSAARKDPGKYSFGSSGAYKASHLMLLSLMRAKNININHIPFRGGGPAIQAFFGNHVTIGSGTPTTAGAMDRVRKGELRALAMTGVERDTKLIPDVPTLREKGVDYIFSAWRFVVAPSGVPKDRLAILEDAFKKASKDKTYKRLLQKLGSQYKPEFGKVVRDRYEYEYNFYGKLFKRLGISKKKAKKS